jgi:ribose transport system permease protein
MNVSTTTSPAPREHQDGGETVAPLLARLRRQTSFWMALAVIALVIFFGFASPDRVFWQYDNLVALSLDATAGLILAFGMTYLLAAGQLDLSVGANVIVSSVLSAKTLVALAGTPEQVSVGEYPHLGPALIVALIVAVAAGFAFSVINAVAIVTLGINSFIATLATTGIGTGIALVITDGIDVPNLPTALQNEFSGVMVLGAVPAPVILPIVLGPVLWWFLNRSSFGTHVQAIGSSRQAAQRAGIPVKRRLFQIHLVMGFMAATAGFVDISRFGTTSVGAHTTDALAAIAACVIGGTSLFGGRGYLGGSAIGTFIPVVLSAGLIIIGITAFWQQIAVGLILLGAVWIDQRRRSSR